jgi:LacI family transcriptional regulator
MSSTTLRDVAELAGVSIGTASAALNNRPTVSQEARIKVVDAAVALGYPLKEQEELARQTKLSVIGLLLKQDHGRKWEINPFYSQVQLGVTDACNRNKLSIMLGNIEVDASNRPMFWPVMLEDQRVDGLILAGVFLDETVAKIQRRTNIPIVLLDGFSGELALDSVITDNLGGARQAMSHLFSHGHRKIGLVGWNPESPPSIQDRYLGYIGAMNVHGYELFVEPSVLFRHGGYEGTKRLLTRHPEITAIFACNDETGVGVMDAAHELGLQVPDGLSVVGFDDIALPQDVDRPITTIHVHKTWMGTMTVSTLIERSRNPDQPKITKVVSTYLVDRDTVKQPKKHQSQKKQEPIQSVTKQ